MPKLVCTCGEVLSYGDIPNPIEWLLISDTDFDQFSGLVEAEAIYKASKSLLRCPHCHRLWVFWDGFQAPPEEYVPNSSSLNFRRRKRQIMPHLTEDMLQPYSQPDLKDQEPVAKISHLTQVIQSWTPEAGQESLALAYYARAEAYHQQKQWDQVIADIEAVIRLLPSNETDNPGKLPDGSDRQMLLAKSYYLLGLARLEKKDYFQAVKAYTTAVSLNPNYWEAYFERAIAYEFSRYYRNAIYDYNTVLKLNPDCALAYYNRGAMHFHLHEHEQAAADYLQAIHLNPQDAYAHFNLGVVYARLDRFKGTYAQKAIESYTRAIELDPQNAEAYYNRGHVYMIKKEYDNQLALADFQKAAELGDPKAKNMLKRNFSTPG